MISLHVSNAMTAPVRTTTAERTATDAAREMRESGIGALVVLDDGEDVSGIVTQSDLIGLVASESSVAEATVGDIMSAPVVTIGTDALVLDAAEVMKEHSVRRLPVVDREATESARETSGETASDELVGIVTTTDLTHYLPRLRNTILRERSERVTSENDPDRK